MEKMEIWRKFVESWSFWNLMTTPLLLALFAVVMIDQLSRYLLRRRQRRPDAILELKLPKLRRDFTVTQLKEYDGTHGDGRILLAVNGIVFDVTKSRNLYGKRGPYRYYAGRDASRNLAKFCVEKIDTDEYDDLIDLTLKDMDKVKEWELQFREKFDVVGRLLRPGQIPNNYDDEDSMCDNEDDDDDDNENNDDDEDDEDLLEVDDEDDDDEDGDGVEDDDENDINGNLSTKAIGDFEFSSPKFQDQRFYY